MSSILALAKRAANVTLFLHRSSQALLETIFKGFGSVLKGLPFWVGRASCGNADVYRGLLGAGCGERL
jgi:hypothetical protein